MSATEPDAASPPPAPPVLSPAGEPRLPRSEVTHATGNTVITAISTIASWLVGVLIKLLPPPFEPPPEVIGAIMFLTLLGVAFGVSLGSAKMRNAQWASSGEITGAKQLL